ncbi:MAG: ABC transporter ATP-binding protein [candidate division Zixibacteria bacterium]|nr:ABC transporter ATP-binding protein [candidate division Zixibacteria bacterium]MDD5426213.1 ABC transporter ATP-binding protein [candidate division Zixibacteria bacterium]
MAESWLKTFNLCRYYRRGPTEVKAVDNVDITLEKGECLGLVGSSGSGKSTLLNLMAGLDTPTSGHIEIEGHSLATLSRRELAAYRAYRVGMVFQSFNLIPHYTALGNVEMALFFNKTPRPVRRRLAIEIMEKLSLADRLDHRPADLSGGEQQRVALARALVKKPEILFADEPTGNLDQDNSRHIASLLKRLNLQGLTIILVTHDLELARSTTGRIIKMHYGQIIETSTSPSKRNDHHDLA